MDSNLVIDDNYVQSVGRKCSFRGKKIEEIMDSYLTILGEIESEAVTEGDIALAITAYKESVQLLNNQISSLSSNIEKICDSFIGQINIADDYLF